MKVSKYLVILVVVFTSCVENTITVRVNPDGYYQMRFKSSGDSTDVFNKDFTHPVPGSGWVRIIKMNVEEEDTIWTMTTDGYLSGQSQFTKDSLAIAPLHHQIDVQKEDGWISSRYLFNHMFSGRKAFTKYPILANALRTNTNLDSIRWLPESFEYICSKAINELQLKQKLELEPLFVERMKNHLHQYLIHVQEEELYNELKDNREKLIQRFFSPFLSQLPTDFTQEMAQCMEPYENELSTTLDLQDDSFGYILIMPGSLVSTNADTVMNDTLCWTFDLEKFLNDDLILEAESVIYSKTKLQKLILLSFVLLMILIGILWKRSK